MAAVGTEPNVPGFIAAQANLRQRVGTPVAFKVPKTLKWPAGTKINPITKLPYDSTIKPEGAVFTTVTKTCLLILKQGSPLRPQSDTEVVALGEVSGMDIIIDIAASDYPEVEHAYEMTVNGLDYQVREAKPFALGGTIYRYLVYGEQR